MGEGHLWKTEDNQCQLDTTNRTDVWRQEMLLSASSGVKQGKRGVELQ